MDEAEKFYWELVHDRIFESLQASLTIIVAVIGFILYIVTAQTPIPPNVYYIIFAAVIVLSVWYVINTDRAHDIEMKFAPKEEREKKEISDVIIEYIAERYVEFRNQEVVSDNLLQIINIILLILLLLFIIFSTSYTLYYFNSGPFTSHTLI